MLRPTAATPSRSSHSAVAATSPAAFEQLDEQGVDGVVVLNEATAAARRTRAPPGSRASSSWTPRPTTRFGVVQSDHAGGRARRPTEHLLALGHATVWHLAGPGWLVRGRPSASAGWREALAAAGALAPAVVRGDWTCGIRSCRGRSRSPTRPDVDRGVRARTTRWRSARCGRSPRPAGRCRRDVSVVGFDDVADAADYLPPLTTVRQDFDELGERAVEALIGAIETGGAREETVPTALMVRESTASAA